MEQTPIISRNNILIETYIILTDTTAKLITLMAYTLSFSYVINRRSRKSDEWTKVSFSIETFALLLPYITKDWPLMKSLLLELLFSSFASKTTIPLWKEKKTFLCINKALFLKFAHDFRQKARKCSLTTMFYSCVWMYGADKLKSRRCILHFIAMNIFVISGDSN